MDKISVSENSVLEECWKGKTENALDKGRFYSLKSLTLESCKLGSCAIPSFVLRCLKGLKELKVQNCRNITSIFELNDNIKGTFQLEKLTLDNLPEVTNVWSQQYKQNEGRFQNLKVVTFKSCRKLKALFPVAIASNLKMLEHLEVRSCYHLLEIVGGGEGQKSFVFPYLIRLRLCNLPQLTHFYDGKFTLECPELSDLHLFDCNKFELFQKPSSVIEGISKVITLRMGSKDTSVLSSWLQQSEKHQLEYLTGLTLTFDDDVKNECSTLDSEIFMRKTTRLKRMDIMNSTSHDKILFLSQNSKPPGNLTEVILQSLFQLCSIVGLEHLSNLRTLKIFQCPLLKTIEKYPPHLEKLYVQGCHGLRCLFTSSAARALKKLEELSVKDSKSLKEIVGKEQDDETAPQQKYLPQLKKLYVQGCHGLRCLFTSSAATALDKLKELSVKDSRSLKEIVGKEQDDETAPQEIELKQLKNINIQSLESLECFYPGNAALNLPSLAQVKICKCTKMTMLSQHLRGEDPSRKISVSFYSRDDKMDDQVTLSQLNLAVGEQFLYQTHLLLNDYPELEGEWVGSSRIPVKRSFKNVKTLVVDGCEFLTNAVLPSHLLRLLSDLENLTVKKCEHVEAIFDVKDTPSEHDDPNKIVMNTLKIINLEELPTLTHVWNNDRKGSLSFPSLEEVSVAECKSIKSLFPASVPRVNLHQLHVRNCGELVEIVARDEAFLQDANNKAITLFPKLTDLMLSGLPKLSCICSGMQSLLDWLVVFKRLYVCGCPMLKLFPADIQNSPNSNPGDEDCFATHNDSHGKVISNLEKLMLSKEDVTMIDEKGFLHVDLQNTKYLGLDNFNDNEFPDAFFSKMSLPNLKEIELVDCAFKDICHSKGYDEGYSKILSQLKSVNLNNLHKLNSMGFEHHWMAPLLQNLETLKVSECNLLTNLAASSASRKAVSFFSLKKLTVENCAGLKNLFTSSTAKSLVALQELSITKCKSLETIVAQETRDKPEDIVVFSKLQTLALIELPLLESFYTGNSTLYFPAISNSAKILFTITKCNKMKTFSHGDVLPKFLQGKIDDDRCYGDLNSAVQEQFKRDLFPIEKFNVAFIHDSPEC